MFHLGANDMCLWQSEVTKRNVKEVHKLAQTMYEALISSGPIPMWRGPETYSRKRILDYTRRPNEAYHYVHRPLKLFLCLANVPEHVNEFIIVGDFNIHLEKEQGPLPLGILQILLVYPICNRLSSLLWSHVSFDLDTFLPQPTHHYLITFEIHRNRFRLTFIYI